MSNTRQFSRPSDPKFHGRVWSQLRRVVVFLLTVAVVIAVVAVFWKMFEPIDRMLAKGRLAVDRGDNAAAELLVNRILSREPDSIKALLLGGDAVAKLGRHQDALDYYRKISDDGSSDAISARCAAGELFRKKNQLSASEQQFRRALKQNPNHILANDRMTYLLGLQTRTWELIPYQLAMLRLGDITPRRMYILILSDDFQTEEGIVQEYQQSSAPHDTGLLLARANWALMEEQDYPLAERLVREVLRSKPDSIEAQVKLGRVLLEAHAETDFLTWNANLPEHANAHPEIWAIRGSRAQQQKDDAVAARCFWEAVRRDPNHQQAIYQLGQALIKLKQAEKAAPFLSRFRLLQQYKNAVYIIIFRASKKASPRELRTAAELAESLNLLWEAYGWSSLSLQQNPRDNKTKKLFTRLEARLPNLSRSSRTPPESNPALRIDLSSYPLPRRMAGSVESAVKTRKETSSQSHPTFEDRAASAGIDFTFFNSANPEFSGLGRMYEFTGGGVAVLDYDTDGNPDIYLTQGCPWPPKKKQQEFLDRLYRNLGNGRFEDITHAAGLAENRFSQGVTIGDFNNDGFPDLYVANIGRNRLYRNNGDGTFTDVTDQTGTAGQRWTTSCLIADLNGDSWPDIYAVNYLSGNDVFTRVCRDINGVLETCLPKNFPASQDQLFLNLGDGRFENVTSSSGIRVPDGAGMGIVAADFDGSGKLSIFVANDGFPNFYFANQTAARGDRPKFVEQALIMGLAANYEGRIEGCMGVAVGDADGDGLIDMFVTNFSEESNTLYRQMSGNTFTDMTVRAGLRAPSINLLGFGTQFLDSELDGHLDLIVANGHIDDYTPQFQLEMPPQYFRNLGDGEFVESSAKLLGKYFEGRYLGRGMARIDWNRDGLEDVVISHLNAPVTLLTNTTLNAGHFLAVKLVGVRSDRDAIGTIVTLKTGGRTLVRQLTAGDGYQASNQRLLIFGLGEAERVDELQVSWRSGLLQKFTDLASDVELLIVEGCSRPVARHPEE